jgi:prolyl oligopeptidase
MPEATPADDPLLWLEDVTGARALAWVRDHNANAERTLASDPRFQSIYQRILAVLDSEAKIPYVACHGPHLYNFWQDGAHPRGVWRRTTFAEYRAEQPQWETVLDLDALGAAEGENWVWHGAQVLRPDRDRALVSLSRGGADAAVVREFDLVRKQFVADGFVLPEHKSQVAWHGRDELLVGTDFGPGALTRSGYPRQAKRWRRGTPLASAVPLAEGSPEDVYLVASHDPTQGFERVLVQRAMTFYTNELHVVRDGQLVRVDKPDSATAHLHREWLLLELRDDWQVGATTHPAGALLACPLEAFLAGARQFDVLFTPSERTSLAGITPTRNHLLLTVLDQVASRVQVLTHRDGRWHCEALPGLPDFGTVSVAAVDDEAGDDYWLLRTDYLQPTSLWHGTVGQGPPRLLKSLPACFDAKGLAVAQHTARSADGTLVPYFLVARADLPHDGAQPTLLYGYGGFEVSLTPAYSAGAGIAWLEAGGVFAVANIRGGGEFGPKWHQAALGPHRHRAYEDFAAVAEDLVRRGITAPSHLGCQGGSNGGLLMGNMLTSYPQQFGAIVCQVPLLDMLRYHRLLAGASWIGEYGDPEQPEAAAWLRRYSPYHNLQRAAPYPPVLFTTSTRDDRVHPGHARKTMAKLEALGHRALYYENLEGGHGGAADHKQAAYLAALAYTFLWQQLR